MRKVISCDDAYELDKTARVMGYWSLSRRERTEKSRHDHAVHGGNVDLCRAIKTGIVKPNEEDSHV